MLTAGTTLTESIAISSIKMMPTALNKLLDELDGNQIIPQLDHRKADRHRCRYTAIIVVVNQHGYQSVFMIPVRDISKSGVAFLHRSMLHRDTPCEIRFRAPNRQWVQISGKVVRSRYVRDMIYEIGLKFDEAVDADQFGWLSAGPCVPPRPKKASADSTAKGSAGLHKRYGISTKSRKMPPRHARHGR